jgi:hypothetical protein
MDKEILSDEWLTGVGEVTSSAGVKNQNPCRYCRWFRVSKGGLKSDVGKTRSLTCAFFPPSAYNLPKFPS